MEAIEEALQRCDRVVAAFPREPQPLNERFLLHSLRGDVDKACRDIAAATRLAARLPADRLDPLLRNELRLRAASCRGYGAGGVGQGEAQPSGQPSSRRRPRAATAWRR